MSIEQCLIHYSDQPFTLDLSYDYSQSCQKWHAKPVGLWFSVESPYDWKWWCEGEDFRVDHLAFSYKITLKPDANIIYLNNAEELFAFTRKYNRPTRYWDPDQDTYQLRWEEIKSLYQGIIIPNYLWDCRLALESSWYYGWDCSSGCIWDLTCIESFEQIHQPTEVT